MEYPISSISLELISKCNLKCVHCRLQLHDYEAANKVMSYDDVISFMDEVKDSNRRVSLTLQGTGEASLHPKMLNIIKQAAAMNFKVATTTNLLSRKKEVYLRFFEVGLDLMTVSIDTLNKSVVDLTRAGTSVEVLKENFSYLVSRYPDKIYVHSVASDLTVPHFDELYEFLNSNGLVNWRFIYLNNWDGTYGISDESIEVLNAKVKVWSKEMEINVPDKNAYCEQPFGALNVKALGYIMPCLYYEDHNIVNFGNVFEGNISEQYNSDKFKRFRADVLTGKADICKVCQIFKKR